jgi:hypothetical protein
MNGKIVTGFIVLTALVAGAALYYLQVYAFYGPIAASSPAAVIHLQPLAPGLPEPMLANDFEGIDAESSPLRFRSYTIYEKPTPLIAPSWFSCFDAEKIGTDLASGAAVAFLSEKNIHPGVDRVVAVYPDGQAFAWQQLNESADQ